MMHHLTIFALEISLTRGSMCCVRELYHFCCQKCGQNVNYKSLHLHVPMRLSFPCCENKHWYFIYGTEFTADLHIRLSTAITYIAILHTCVDNKLQVDKRGLCCVMEASLQYIYLTTNLVLHGWIPTLLRPGELINWLNCLLSSGI